MVRVCHSSAMGSVRTLVDGTPELKGTPTELVSPVYLHTHSCMCKKEEKESEVTQSCLNLCDPMDCSLPGSSVRGIFQARILEWVAISSSRTSSPIQGSNPSLLHCRQTLYRLSQQGSPGVYTGTNTRSHAHTEPQARPGTEAFPSSDIPSPVRCRHLPLSSPHPLVSLRPPLLQPVCKPLRAHS